MPVVVSALIPDGQGRIFVQKRSARRKLFPDCWDLVGGHVEEGERLDAALAREIWEETGWRLRAVGIEIGAKTWSAGGVDYLERQFIVGVDGDLQSPRLEAEKVTECRWVDEATAFILKENRPEGDTLIYDAVVEALRYTRPHAEML